MYAAPACLKNGWMVYRSTCRGDRRRSLCEPLLCGVRENAVVGVGRREVSKGLTLEVVREISAWGRRWRSVTCRVIIVEGVELV